MEQFKSEAFTFVIGIILIFGFFFGIAKTMCNRLEGLGVRPKRSANTGGSKESEESKEPLWKRMKSIVEFWCEEIGSNYRVLGQIGGRIKEKIVPSIGDMILVIIFSVVMAFFCTYSEDGVDTYMTTFMTMMYVMFALVLFSQCVGGSKKIYLPCCLMILCGIALAVLLSLSPMAAIPANLIEKAEETVDLQKIAIILALVAFPLIRMVCRTERRGTVLIILNLAIIACYLALFVVGKEINGARNWIYIGGFSIQVSEITKVLSIAAFALTLTYDDMPDGKWTAEYKRLTWATITMAINGVFLLVCNEFGTLILLCAVYVVLGVIYQKKLDWLICYVTVAMICAVIGMLFCKDLYSITPKKPVQKITVVADAGETFAYQKENVELLKKTEKEKIREPELEMSPLIKYGGKIYKKFQDRVSILYDKELQEDDEYLQNEGYQWKKAHDALMLSEWFGSPYDVAVPVARSDFIFNYLMVRMGMVAGFAILLLLLYMLCEGAVLCLRNPFTGEASVALAFLFAMVVQAVIAAASATGNFMIVGIPFPFLAYGGSAAMMNYSMLTFIIYATRSDPNDFRQLRKRKN